MRQIRLHWVWMHNVRSYILLHPRVCIFPGIIQPDSLLHGWTTPNSKLTLALIAGDAKAAQLPAPAESHPPFDSWFCHIKRHQNLHIRQTFWLVSFRGHNASRRCGRMYESIPLSAGLNSNNRKKIVSPPKHYVNKFNPSGSTYRRNKMKQSYFVSTMIKEYKRLFQKIEEKQPNLCNFRVLVLWSGIADTRATNVKILKPTHYVIVYKISTFTYTYM